MLFEIIDLRVLKGGLVYDIDHSPFVPLITQYMYVSQLVFWTSGAFNGDIDFKTQELSVLR